MFKDTGILLIGHGSKDPEGIQEYLNFTKLVQEITSVTVQKSFIEFARPSLKEALTLLAQDDLKKIVGIPLVLLGALHHKNDGPQIINYGRRFYSNVEFCYARALGIHTKVLETARLRIKDQIITNRLEPNETAVVLISRGSTDPDANSDLYKIARLISDDPDLPETILPGFVSLSQPDVFKTIKTATKLGYRNIIVMPYFLFTGVLCKRIYSQAQLCEAELDIKVFQARHLGPDKNIALAVADRFHEALTGNTLMNCDLCAYRVKMPGYEYKLENHNH
jgi:sirohydrochlorin ferrochelatase